MVITACEVGGGHAVANDSVNGMAKSAASNLFITADLVVCKCWLSIARL